MTELTETQKKLAREAVARLKKLQNEGVEIMTIDGGGGNSGLTFWIPENDERRNAYELIDTDDFKEKSYYPTKSIGLRIDIIVP